MSIRITDKQVGAIIKGIIDGQIAITSAEVFGASILLNASKYEMEISPLTTPYAILTCITPSGKAWSRALDGGEPREHMLNWMWVKFLGMVQEKIPAPSTEAKTLALEVAEHDSQPCPTCSIVWGMREGPIPTIAECKKMPNKKGRHAPGPDLSKVEVLPATPPEVVVETLYKVCVTTVGGGLSGVGFHFNKGVTASGVQFPTELANGAYFSSKEEAEAAAAKYAAYRKSLDQPKPKGKKK